MIFKHAVVSNKVLKLNYNIKKNKKIENLI